MSNTTELEVQEENETSKKINSIISLLKGETYSMAEYILDRTMKRIRSRTTIT